ncbi:hypothetical protein [Streptomyces katsurahamanus]|uniref:Uncharacterized protein n=1 Tax=Streptomyces katsurahamanus TaxID=2577098 RepID=A0ABW9NUQ7_9ACTN|nr:hypothetical protein [Streptomyces katsurahamanus]MQS37036.1 hypothetical protein [Streptomyces katsurahamanus]
MADTPAAGSSPRLTPGVLRAAVVRHRLVNLTGPLGSGKSWLVSRLPSASVLDLSRPGAADAVSAALGEHTGRPLVLDGADGPAALSALEGVRSSHRAEGRPLLLVSRRSLLAHPDWTLSGAVVLGVLPWQDERIRRLTADAQLRDARGQELVVRLAGGNPLIAAAACRALHTGASPDAPGAVADQVAREIVERLSREQPAHRWQPALERLAVIWSGDKELLEADRELFDALGRLSLVTSTELGLTVLEPFRSVLERACRWRQPVAHGDSRARALAYRKRQLTGERAVTRRSRLAEGAMALSGDETLREILFPASPPTGVIQAATRGDADAVGGLMHQWARQGGMDTRRTDRLVEQWLCDDPDGFQLARDGDGRPVGLVGVLRVAEHTVSSVEPLLQQHTDRLLERRRTGGLLLGAAYCPDRGLHARLLRDLLHRVMAGNLLLTVSTPTPRYQRLLSALRFQRHGTTADDVYRCGRKPEIYSQDFGHDAITEWAGRFALEPGADGSRRPTGREVGQALARIGDTARLAHSPLLRTARTATVTDLQEWLRDAVRALADSDVPEDAEAGWILLHYYLGRPQTHQQLARRLHMSRATYFRRLRHGLDVLVRRLPGD